MNQYYCPKCSKVKRYPPAMVFKSQEVKDGELFQHYECDHCGTKMSTHIGVIIEEEKCQQTSINA